MIGAAAFNLLVNASLSFGGAALLIWLALRLFRPRPDGAQLVLLGAPWLKLFWDAAHGIPESSFFWQRLLGIRQDLGSFQFGLGFNHWGPLIQLRLGAQLDGARYSQSAAEVLDSALSRVLPGLSGYLACTVLFISALLAARRVAGWLVHWRSRGRSHTLPAKVCRTTRRGVRVYLDANYNGVPYAAGIREPYVVFSAAHYARLSPDERDACLLHELSHIRRFDTLFSPLLGLFGDLCWFLPASRWLHARFHALMELRADSDAIAAGASPQALASALVRSSELLRHPTPAGVGLLRATLLRFRVERLLTPSAEPAPRAGFGRAWLRIALCAIVVLSILQAGFFGNHSL